jgi:SAM-dependent methyltransferase
MLHEGGGFKSVRLYPYASYQEYRDAQVRANREKLDLVWAQKAEIRRCARYLKRHLGKVESGLCHGSRNGAEVLWFREYLGADVTGTDISETAGLFPHMITWDFHEIKAEWAGKFDFIYSNSFDHTLDPIRCLRQWMSCLKPEGVCLIEWSASDEAEPSWMHPFSATLEEYKTLLSKDYVIRDVIYLKRRPAVVQRVHDAIEKIFLKLRRGFVRKSHFFGSRLDKYVFVVGLPAEKQKSQGESRNPCSPQA